MTKFYSRTTKGFYESSIHKVMPEDAYEISDEVYHSLLQEQVSGKIIIHNGDNPKAIDRPAINVSAENMWDMIREKRNQLLKDSDFSQLTDVQDLMTDEQKAQWIAYRTALRNITNAVNPGNVKFPEKPKL